LAWLGAVKGSSSNSSNTHKHGEVYATIAATPHYFLSQTLFSCCCLCRSASLINTKPAWPLGESHRPHNTATSGACYTLSFDLLQPKLCEPVQWRVPTWTIAVTQGKVGMFLIFPGYYQQGCGSLCRDVVKRVEILPSASFGQLYMHQL
jgi:hypothetical protein